MLVIFVHWDFVHKSSSDEAFIVRREFVRVFFVCGGSFVGGMFNGCSLTLSIICCKVLGGDNHRVDF